MIDVFALLEVAEDAVGRQPIGTTFADLRTLYGVYEKAAALKQFDVVALLSDKAMVATIARTVNLFVALQGSEATAPHLAALLKSLNVAPAPVSATEHVSA